ncbi:MAG: metallophosphoesterase family protein [Bacteroidota bacterium]
MRKWVIPDIHGCCKTLISLVENKIQPTKDDVLIFLGDYIDRGPDSKGVIDYLIRLQQSDIPVICLLGNHEEAMLNAYSKELNNNQSFSLFGKKNKALNFWMNIGGDTTLESFKVKKVSQIPESYFTWIKNLQLYYESEKHIVVHAGFNFNCDEPFLDTSAMTTVRDFEVDLIKTNQRKIVHGHVQLSLDFIKFSIQDDKMTFIGLDNGCVHQKRIGMGNLLALDLNSLNLLIQPNIDLI